MDYLENIGIFMQRERIEELFIKDGGKEIVIKRPVETTKEEEGEEFIVSPVAGVFRSKTDLSDEPSVREGDIKRKGEPLFYMESMKHVNEIRAEFDQQIVEINVMEGEIVGVGRRVLRIRRLCED